jgi:hypothetical protein
VTGREGNVCADARTIKPTSVDEIAVAEIAAQKSLFIFHSSQIRCRCAIIRVIADLGGSLNDRTIRCNSAPIPGLAFDRTSIVGWETRVRRRSRFAATGHRQFGAAAGSAEALPAAIALYGLV